MPEGHTIHRLARDHRKAYAGHVVRVSSPQGRFAAEADRLDGQRLVATEARGKHLFHLYESGCIVHIHLGLYGKFRSHRCPPPEPTPTVRMRVVGPNSVFDLVGPNCCEIINGSEQQAILERLGEDPLDPRADPTRVWQRISRSRAPIGTLLLNQSVFAGVGNVYRADVLFDQRLHPERPGNELTREQFDRLWGRLCEWLAIGVRYNRIITADPSVVGRTRGRMRRDERLLVYKKETCPVCSSKIDCWELASRWIYACSRCQI